jgi:hypothetical protein
MEWVLIVIFVIIILFSFLSSSSSDFIGWPLFSNAERSFFGGLTQALGDEYVVMGKVRVADILSPQKGLNKSNWQTAFNKVASKHFDYVLCTRDTFLN